MIDHEQHMIRIWPFSMAPLQWQEYSTNGGDEDWLAILPATMKGDVPYWLEGSSFGCSSIDQYEGPNGCLIIIGSHA